MEQSCKICNTQNTSIIKTKDNKVYHLCKDCRFIRLDPEWHPLPELEKKRYDLHQNDINDQGYRDFLHTAIDKALPFLNKNMKGLDFGCGPAPVLAHLMGNQGYHCDYYDPFYYPELPGKNYDFIFATECLEHFHNPLTTIREILSKIRHKGLWIIKTNFWKESQDFQNWHYRRDDTHVGFFHFDTINYFSCLFPVKLKYCDKQSVAIFEKVIQ